MRVESLSRKFIRFDQPSARRPALEPSARPGAQRSREMLIRREQIVSRARHRFGIRVDQWSKQGEVVLGFINRDARVGGRGPAEPPARARLGAQYKFVEAGKITFRRSQCFKPVERRHARPSLLNVDPRIRKMNSFGSGSYSQS